MPDKSYIPREFWLLCLITLDNAQYRFGAEANPANPDPPFVDCSEAVEWSTARAGVRPTVPDGAANQYQWCKRWGCELTVEQAINTRGALLFKKGPRAGIDHVAVSLGDGTTFEARNRAYDVGRFNARGRGFDLGGLLPGIDYSAPNPH